MAGRFGEIGPGLVLMISFTQGASEDKIRPATKFILTAKLSTAAVDEQADSVAALCRRGVPQGIVVMPQASLVAEVEQDLGLLYRQQCASRLANQLYQMFVEASATPLQRSSVCRARFSPR